MVAQVYKHSSIWEYHTVKLEAQGQAELYKKRKASQTFLARK